MIIFYSIYSDDMKVRLKKNNITNRGNKMPTLSSLSALQVVKKTNCSATNVDKVGIMMTPSLQWMIHWYILHHSYKILLNSILSHMFIYCTNHHRLENKNAFKNNHPLVAYQFLGKGTISILIAMPYFALKRCTTFYPLTTDSVRFCLIQYMCIYLFLAYLYFLWPLLGYKRYKGIWLWNSYMDQ